MIPVWRPTLAVLSETCSGDEVLRALRFVGFGGFAANCCGNGLLGTIGRKLAYLEAADKNFSRLSEGEQWPLATALARVLAEHTDRNARLLKALERIGWQFDGAHFHKL